MQQEPLISVSEHDVKGLSVSEAGLVKSLASFPAVQRLICEQPPDLPVNKTLICIQYTSPLRSWRNQQFFFPREQGYTRSYTQLSVD